MLATRRRDDAWRTVSALADKQAVGLLFGTRRVAASRPSSAKAHAEIKPAHERDTPAVSLPQLALSVRLCDHADLPRAFPQVCKGIVSKDCAKLDQDTRTT